MPDELSNQVTAIPAGTPEAIPQAIQLRLLPAPQPLTHRLGKEFFGALPRTPGVYRFHDSTNRIIYVGKARDLRQRLSSYRSTTHASRKTKRMLAFAETVSFEECASEAAAFLRENELLRTLRPRFNRMNVYPPAYAFIVLWATETTLHLELRRGNVEVNQAGAKIHGAFKAGGAYTFAALLRLLHAGSHGRFDSLTLPRQLLAERPPQSWDVLSSDALGLMDKVGMFLRAEPAPFAAWLVEQISTPNHPFDAALLRRDVELLDHFLKHGPRRNEEFRRLFGLDSGVIQPEQLDDFNVLHRFQPRTLEPPMAVFETHPKTT